ncbi:unnamed protein product [Linum tenue]|uniref:Basic blue protein n=1 Tax=Linum tenue TaxID=586396 RepID=A0AAV0LXN3_9ROSI|nr:unnamed protein product [Linum tenue]
MAQNGSSRVGACCISLLLIIMLFCQAAFFTETAAAATYTIEWAFGVTNWPNGKNFKAGDVIVFHYEQGEHEVAVVDANGYKTCTVPTGAKIYTSGNDRVTLQQGNNYFICDIPQHCDQGGMKIAVTAA